MGAAFLRKYATLTHVYVPLLKRGSVDFAVGADWTPAAGDVKVSIDGGAAANIGTLPTAIVMGNTAMWDFTIATGEVTGKKISISIADSATKAVEDDFFVIETYGNASAQYPPNFEDAVRLGLTALPNAAAEAAGGLFTRGSGAGQIAQDANGRVDVNARAWNSIAVPTSDEGGPGYLDAGTLSAISATQVTLPGGHGLSGVKSAVIFLFGGTNAKGKSRVLSHNTGDIFDVDPAWNAGGETTPSGTIIYAVVPAPPAPATSVPAVDVTKWNGSAVGAPDTAGFPKVTIKSGTGAGELSLASGLVELSTAGIAAIWNALTSGMSTAGSIGKRIIDFLTGDIFARVGAPAGASVSADIAAATGRLPAALVGGRMDANMSAVAGSATAATKLGASALGIASGKAVTGTLSTTQATTNQTFPNASQVVGRSIVFTSNNVIYAASVVTAATVGGLLTWAPAIPVAPANNDDWVVV